MANAKVEGAFERVQRLVAHKGLPRVDASTSYGAPALRVAGKPFATIKGKATLSLSCTLEHKEFLIAAAPQAFYETHPTADGRPCWCAWA